MLALHTILYPTDYSACSQYALEAAISLVREQNARLLVLHVAVPRRPVHGGGIVSSPPPSAQVELAELLGRLEQLGIPAAVEPQLSDGDPATEILRVARESKCDLIVMGTHGRSGWGRLLVGSVAEEVLRKAPCPVVTVKVPEPVAQKTAREVEGERNEALNPLGNVAKRVPETVAARP